MIRGEDEGEDWKQEQLLLNRARVEGGERRERRGCCLRLNMPEGVQP